MSGVRRTAVWLLCWTLVLPPHSVALVAAPLGPSDAAASAAGAQAQTAPVRWLQSVLERAAAYGAPGGFAAAPLEPDFSCAPGRNPIVCENEHVGAPREEWDLPSVNPGDPDGPRDAGDPTIQGFATDISVDQGQTIAFKVDTDANSYRLDIYRLGYYGGSGARFIESVTPTATLPQAQPACIVNTATGLIDCGNWNVSASWLVPANATSGIYLAKLVRSDTQGASHIVFVVRDDDGHSDVLFQTSDTTWQAYNNYGGNSLYLGGPAGRAYQVSYNRPFSTRGVNHGGRESWVFNAEYPMVRWLEANGYSVSYSTGVDTDRRGAELTEHRVFLSVGHDEYWSGAQRANVEAARSAGVNLAFLSGNEVFWKTRWEADASGSSHRTLVCYKETHANAKIDPQPAWTGTWRDPRFSPPSEGGRPENALTGTIFTVNAPRNDAIVVRAADGKMRFWRGTSIAQLSGTNWTALPAGTLGYEWDEDLDNGVRPPGLMRLSSTTVQLEQEKLLDYGSTYGAGTATHSLTLYRHRNPNGSRGGLVFGAGTVQWSWGLDDNHDRPGAPPDAAMQQATVNLLADMDAQPDTLKAGLTRATKSTDESGPTSTVNALSPAAVEVNVPVTVTGTATDANTGGGAVGGVEVSTDGGVRWHAADGRESWSYRWTPGVRGSTSILSRASDDSGNVGPISSAVVARVCPCSIWDNTATPQFTDSGDQNPAPVEVGVKFRALQNGFITALRFYKSPSDTGANVLNLWRASGGNPIASATFANSTASGWQEVRLREPVAVDANVTYIASYHSTTGQYVRTPGYFLGQSASNPPLIAPDAGTQPNGVYSYAPASVLPSETFQGSNYWVDVVFDTDIADTPPDTAGPIVIATMPAQGVPNVPVGSALRATFDEAIQPATINTATFELRDALGAQVTGAVTYDPLTRNATFTPASALAYSTAYTATIKGEAGGVADVAGMAMAANYSWSFTTAGPDGCPCTIWSDSATPAVLNDPDTRPVEVGVKFRAQADGFITALRFYKGPNATGTHVGHLWKSDGTLLATATFTSETAFGWQQAALPAAVEVQAGVTYVASYFAPDGGFSKTAAYFDGAAFTNPPLTALADDATTSNGVFNIDGSGFPTASFGASNYWVDVVFDTTPPVPDSTPPTVASTVPAAAALGVSTTAPISATFSESIDPATLVADTFEVRRPGGTRVSGQISYNTVTRTAALTPTQPLEYGAIYTATLRGGAGLSTVKDRAGNSLAADYTWSFTTALALACPCSIWDDLATPAIESDGFSGPIELGVRFRADTDGYITGLRFYKGPLNHGPHVGSLWSNTGVQSPSPERPSSTRPRQAGSRSPSHVRSPSRPTRHTWRPITRPPAGTR